MRKRGRKPTDPIERFLDKIKLPANLHDCWEWNAGRSTAQGYGVFYLNNKPIGAHRFSYEHFNGSIPVGLWVLHTCDNRPCVNPFHLFVGTAQDNISDMIKKGRKVSRPGGLASRKHKHLSEGVTPNGKKFRVSRAGIHVGCFDTPEEAKQAFEQAGTLYSFKE